MSQFAIHTSMKDERWDTIAYRYYGDANRISPLAEANPHIALLPHLESGLTVLVPILTDTVTTITEALPPWKR